MFQVGILFGGNLVRKATTNQWNLFYTAKSGKYHRPKKQPFPLEISLYNLWGCFSQPFWSHSVCGLSQC